MRVPQHGVVRASVVAVIAAVAVVAAACAPPPEADVADWYEGGTYPIELVVEPQTVTTEFTVFGLVECTSSAVTPSLDLRGTLTVAPAQLDPAASSVVIPGATVELPGASVSAGSLSLTCNGTHIGTVGVSLAFDAAASVRSVVLDTQAGSLTLADPTLTLTDVRATFAGAPSGTEPLPLDPITVTVPTLDVAL